MRINEVIKRTTAKSVPAKPGSTPVKPGFVRLYHQTGEDELQAIEREGLLFKHARGIEGPKAIYAGETPFYGKADGRPTLEFQVPKEWWYSPFVLHDVPPEYFIAAHYPWHSKVRFLIDNPDSMENALTGKYDSLKSADYAQAVVFVKQNFSL